MIDGFPHCDSRILHAPGACEYCDRRSDWQELRDAWGINFTGEAELGKLPCPADTARPGGAYNSWRGNVAVPDLTAEVLDRKGRLRHRLEQLLGEL